MSGGEIALGRDAATPSKHVESNSLSEQKVPSSSPYGRDVLDGLERLPLFYVPFHPVQGVNTTIWDMNAESGFDTHSQPS
jgi:hypothetical protein